jgi:hypothetical protein
LPTRPSLLLRAVTNVLLRPLLRLADGIDPWHWCWRIVAREIRDRSTCGDFGAYRPTARDVIVCTFPKAGTNWALQIACQISTRGQGEYEHIHDVVPWPDGPKGFATPLEGPEPRPTLTGHRVIKTHHEWGRIPYAPEARYICVLRDPKDMFVSQYHFFREGVFGPLMPPVATWLAVSLSRDAPFPWAAHVDGYWRERQRPNLLLLVFEEMKADLPGAVRRVADFMGVQLDGHEFALVCEKSSFAWMKANNRRFNSIRLSPWTSPDRQMVRRGVCGGSAELLTPAQQEAIDAFCRESLRRIGSDFPYDRFWGRPAHPA